MARIERPVDRLARDLLWVGVTTVVTVVLVVVAGRVLGPEPGSAAAWVVTVLPAVVVTLALVHAHRTLTATAAGPATDGVALPGRTLRLRAGDGRLTAEQVAGLFGALDGLYLRAYRFAALEDEEEYAPPPLVVTRVTMRSPLVVDVATAGVGGRTALAALGVLADVVTQPADPAAWFRRSGAGARRAELFAAEARADAAVLRALGTEVLIEPARAG